MSNQGLSDRDFIYSRFDDYLSDLLTGSDAERFRRLLQDESLKATAQIDDTKRAIGMFQMGLQSYFLSEEQRSELQNFAENPEQRRTREIQRIDQLSRWEAFADFRKRLAIIAVSAGLVFALIYRFTPDSEPRFDAMQTLVYESAAMEERGLGKLDLPTEHQAEIDAFFAASRGLDYEPRSLKGITADWHPEGATVIDYDVRKIMTSIYTHNTTSEKLFYFNFKGSINDLPKAEAFTEGTNSFYPYANDTYSIICWQASPNSVGMLLGHKSPRDLARLVGVSP